MKACPICSSSMQYYFSQRILGKYDVGYYLCNTCKLLQTETPYWLEEAYSDAIAVTDTGIARRNNDAAIKTAALFKWMFKGQGKYIDLAGGYGLFTRMMRDFGFDYFWNDRYATNIFAKGFEYIIDSDPQESFEAATAFEVLEHTIDPMEFIANAFTKTGCKSLFFSTELYKENTPPKQWWYYGLNTGQHISFFHKDTLKKISEILQLKIYSNGSFHLFSKVEISRFAYRLLTGRAVAKILPIVSSKLFDSFLVKDHLDLISHQNKERQ